jgi:hypothetical protein
MQTLPGHIRWELKATDNNDFDTLTATDNDDGVLEKHLNWKYKVPQAPQPSHLNPYTKQGPLHVVDIQALNSRWLFPPTQHC